MSKYDKSNIFAQILREELPAEKTFENDYAVVIKDKYPDAPLHHLVLCKGEYVDLRDFLQHASVEEKLTFLDAIQHELEQFDGGAKVGFNIEKDGGQVIFHLHAHVMGRFKDV